MTDFLSHIAARALRAEPGIRPRLPSRFEPVTSAGAHMAPDPWPDDEGGGAPHPDRSPGGLGIDLERDAAPAPIVGVPRRHLDDVGGRGGMPGAPFRSGPLPPAALRPGEVGNPTAPAAANRRHAAADGKIAPAPVAPANDRPAVPRVPAARPVAKDRREPAIPPPGEPQVRVVARMGDPDRPGPIVRAERPQHWQGVSEQVPPGGREEREARVQITIGRIEVRAVSGPAPRTLPTPSPGPRLGLADYLKLRAGGGR